MIPMQLNINYLIGDAENFSQIESVKPLEIFSNEACEFLNAVSKKLLAFRNFPDVMTFGFWIRRASTSQMAAAYKDLNRIGRGIIFHIAPSNVPVNFAYSFAAGLLAGNVNIVRVPSKNFPQVEIICNALKNALNDFPEMEAYVYMVRYGHEREINDLFSGVCDTRVIWGGDATINEIRKSPLKVRANEITFADRYSISVIQADEYLSAENKTRIAQDFYNATYLNDQNACNSPKIIIWQGKDIDSAREIFWQNLQEIVNRGYNLQAVQAVDKLVKFDLLAMNKKTVLKKSANNKIIRAEIFSIDADLINYAGNSGFFLEYVAQDLTEILPICGVRCQTLSYFGYDIDALKNFVKINRPRGIDRIVPFSRTLDFGLNWDGYDLIYSMSRIIAD